MERSALYRKSSIERIQSPEQLNDYLRVTKPSVWVLLAAAALLLVGLLIWGSLTSIGSFAQGSARVESGVMTLVFEDEAQGAKVEAGMRVNVGETQSVIRTVGRGADGRLFAEAETALPDGSYEASVTYRETQLLKLLFN